MYFNEISTLDWYSVEYNKVHLLVFYTLLNWKMHDERVKLKNLTQDLWHDVTLPRTVILAALTLQPLPTVSAEQSCFRSDNTRSCLVISIHSNTRLLRQCECTSSTAQTPGDSARRSQKQVMHFMLSSLKRFFFCYILCNRSSWIQPSLHFPIFHGTWCQFFPYSVMTLSHTHPRFHNPCLAPFPMDFIFTIWNLSSNWNLFHT